MKMRMTRTYTHGGLDVVETLLKRYRADMWISMEDEIRCDWGNFRNERGEKYEGGRLLNEYLISCFSREDIEKEAEQILFGLCPSMLKKPCLIKE